MSRAATRRARDGAKAEQDNLVMVKCLSRLLVASVLVGIAPGMARAQGQPGGVDKTACGTPVGQPAALPPAGSPPFVWIFEPCFAAQGGSSTIDSDTYLYYIQLRNLVSRPSQGIFVPYDEKVEQT